MATVSKTVLESLVNKSPSENLVLRLYGNNVDQVAQDSAARYVEIAGSGYKAAELPGSGWGEAKDGLIDHPPVRFEFSGPVGRVYGYFLTQSISGKLLVAERFTDGPYDVAHVGDQIKVTPILRHR